MSTKQGKEEFYGRCLLQRKRHYFGRDTGWAGGMGQSGIHYCIWCGKYNPKWEPKFWEEESKMKISQKRKCEGMGEYSACKALSSYIGFGGKNTFCTLGYQTSHRKVCINFVYYDKDIKPLEPCPKPMTFDELIEARKKYEKQEEK